MFQIFLNKFLYSIACALSYNSDTKHPTHLYIVGVYKEDRYLCRDIVQQAGCRIYIQ